MNDSRSRSCHVTTQARRARELPRPSYSFLSLLLLHGFLPSRHREIRSRRRSAALKPRAGNGSRRPGAKCVRTLSDRDGGGAVVLFLSRSYAAYRPLISVQVSDEEGFAIDFNHQQKSLNETEKQNGIFL